MPRGHPFASKYSNASKLARRFVFSYDDPVSDELRAVFQGGHDGEERAIELYEAATGRKVARPGLMVSTEPNAAHRGGSCDGLVLGPVVDGVQTVERVIEVKTAVRRQIRVHDMADGRREAEVPDYYLAQPAWYAYLVDAPVSDFLQYDPRTDALWVTTIQSGDISEALGHIARGEDVYLTARYNLETLASIESLSRWSLPAGYILTGRGDGPDGPLPARPRDRVKRIREAFEELAEHPPAAAVIRRLTPVLELVEDYARRWDRERAPSGKIAGWRIDAVPPPPNGVSSPPSDDAQPPSKRARIDVLAIPPPPNMK